MIRRVLIGCLGLAFAVALAACGDTKQPKTDASKVSGASGAKPETAKVVGAKAISE